ncbi:MAG: TSUP family transporter [Clostridia bacterium]|nr:TSUP family transporter [Clostridia bacterium]
MIPLKPSMFFIVCPLLFLTGFVDAIGGGGGLISLPAYLFAGLPVHMAIATNKLSSACGTCLVTARYIRSGMVTARLVPPTVLAAFCGSFLGAQLSLRMDEQIMKTLLIFVLPAAAFVVLNRHLFSDEAGSHFALDRRTFCLCTLSAFVIGAYDGFYGPGTGTFLIIAFTALAGMPMGMANGQAKVINLTTNLTSLAVFLASGQVVWALGLAGAACNMAGSYLGSGLAIRKGAKIVRPVILAVLLLLFIKILTGF